MKPEGRFANRPCMIRAVAPGRPLLGANLLLHSLGESIRPALQFLRRNILDMGEEGPREAERVENLAVASAPELVCERHRHLGAGSHGSVPQLVDILHADVQDDRAPAQRGRGGRACPVDSSASWKRESPSFIVACMTLPSGVLRRNVNCAPKACW